MAFIDYFKSLKDMPIDYGNNDYQSQYRGIISQEIFEETLSYDAFRDDEKRIGEYFNPRHRIYTGVFHLVLNVKVDSMSKFIPFAFVTNTDPLNKDKAEENKDKAKEIIKKKQNDIKFNFTDLLDEFCNIKGDAIDTISFKTTIGRNGLRISGLDVDNDTSLINDYKDYLKKFLKQKGNFISILSESYNSENIANKLFFSIISFDYDIVSDRKLTHILIISENKDESEYFIQYRIRVLRDIVSLLRTRYINDIAKKNRLESLKSAVSAIMSRNMSHNLGSHCLHYTKSSLENLSARLSMVNSK